MKFDPICHMLTNVHAMALATLFLTAIVLQGSVGATLIAIGDC